MLFCYPRQRCASERSGGRLAETTRCVISGDGVRDGEGKEAQSSAPSSRWKENFYTPLQSKANDAKLFRPKHERCVVLYAMQVRCHHEKGMCFPAWILMRNDDVAPHANSDTHLYVGRDTCPSNMPHFINAGACSTPIFSNRPQSLSALLYKRLWSISQV